MNVICTKFHNHTIKLVKSSTFSLELSSNPNMYLLLMELFVFKLYTKVLINTQYNLQFI